MLIGNEARPLKLAETGVKWSALELLKAERVIDMIGMVFNNRVTHLAGLLGLISRDSLWDELWDGIKWLLPQFHLNLMMTIWGLHGRVHKLR